MKYRYLGIAALLLMLLSIRDAAGQSTDTYLNSYVQPAPNAASLGQYADYPVSYYTGTPQITIPIYNLKDGSIHVPISLSYHASGIRVSENASWVGLGWALNAGGVIMRTVKGAPDEGTTKSFAGALGPSGYYKDNGLSTMPLLPYPGEDPDTYQDFTNFFIPAVNFGAKDCEPDLYTFNFNGHVGKFVFDENRVPRMLTDDDLQIKVSYVNGQFKDWMIATPDGTQYYFGENDVHEINYPHSTRTGEDQDGKAIASWYLTRIVNPNTKETAVFSYTPEYYSYRDLGPETNLYGSGPPGGSDDIVHACDNSDINRIPDIITTGVYGMRLLSVSTKNYTVSFVANNARQDLLQFNNYPAPGVPVMPGTHTANSLDGITVSCSGSNIKQYTFSYNYFTSTGQTSAGVITALNQYNNDVTDTKRLKLISITEKSGDGTTANPPYSFTYDESLQLPRRLSFDQDHWGFSNNFAGNSNVIFTPTVHAGYCIVTTTGANRAPKWPDMRAFTLTGIINPLGGSTGFQYEAHNTSSNSDPAYMVGGLRIKQIQATDNITGVTETRKFDYSAGGILYRRPDDFYLVQLKNEYYHTGNMPNPNSGYDGYSGGSGIIYNVLRSSQTIVPLQDPQGNHVSYGYVKELFGLNGENGHRDYKYSVDLSPNSNSSRIDMVHYTAIGTVAGITGLYGNGLFNGIPPQNLIPYYAPYTSNYLHPVAPLQVDIRRGNLLGTYIYDASENLLESVENTYGETLHEDYPIRGFKVYRAQHTNSGGTHYNMDGLCYYKLHTGISHLVSTTKKSMDAGRTVTEVTSYTYDSPYHTQATTTSHTNSNGDVILKQTFYSFDYFGSVGTVFPKMKARNYLVPVMNQTWKNGNLMASSVTEYQDLATNVADTLIYPARVHALESAALLTPAQAGENPVWTVRALLVPNNYFEERAAYNYDGTTSKPLDEKLTAGADNGYQWGYNDTYPVAKVINAANTYHITNSPSTGGSGVTMPKGSILTYTIPFTVYLGGTANVAIGFSGSPGTNPLVQISCILTGPNGYSNSFQLCTCAGTASCGTVPSSKAVTGLAAGSYVLSAYYYQAVNQNSDINLTVSYPSSTITTTGIKEFYYDGFEDSSSAGVITGTGHTGVKYMGTSPYTVSWTPPNGRAYVISYWYLSGGVWTYSGELAYPGTSYILSNGATGYDDIRIYPKDAQMSTYTYDPAAGITSSTDAKGETTYYEYDDFQRLKNIRDKDGNITKHMDYHFHNP